MSVASESSSSDPSTTVEVQVEQSLGLSFGDLNGDDIVSSSQTDLPGVTFCQGDEVPRKNDDGISNLSAQLIDSQAFSSKSDPGNCTSNEGISENDLEISFSHGTSKETDDGSPSVKDNANADNSGDEIDSANADDSGDEIDNAKLITLKDPKQSVGRRPFVPSLRGRRGGPIGPRFNSSFLPARNNRNQEVRRNVPFQRFNKFENKSDDGSVGFVSNWGYRSNLIDQDGNFQRATTDLKNYIAFYKAKYNYFFDLVNGRYPQFVRKFENNMEIWRMSFNVYASGFSDYIAHLGEIHAFYQMELVNNELRWVYKDFNFYPNKMRYGFRVNSYDIADIHSRFIKFICMRDSIVKQFPYVNIKHRIFIFQKFDDNLRNMMNRLSQVKLADIDSSSINEDNVASSDDGGDRPPAVEQPRQVRRLTFPNPRGQFNNRNNISYDSFANFKNNYNGPFRNGPPINRRGFSTYSRSRRVH